MNMTPREACRVLYDQLRLNEGSEDEELQAQAFTVLLAFISEHEQCGEQPDDNPNTVLDKD